MTRPIKFRAWDTFDNKMVSPETATDGEFIAVGFHGLPVVVDPDSFKGGKVIGWNVEHRYKLMQFTGLKDKNGVEIYEGDVLAHPDYIIKPGAAVQWIETHGSWSVGEGWPFVEFYDCGIEACEVIGNIHENPELIEKAPGGETGGDNSKGVL